MKNPWKKIVLCCFIALPVLQLACLGDADRKNPLDPQSKLFQNTGVVSGQVLTFYSPFLPLEGAEIRMEPGPLVAVSDAQGRFQVNEVPPEQYSVTVSKAGYATVTDTVAVALNNNPDLVFHLDGLPEVVSLAVRTARIDRWFPATQLLLLQVETQLTDPDGLNDISFVELEIPEIGFRDTLSLTQQQGVFDKTIVESDLPGRNLFDVQGREIYVRAHDQAGSSVRSEAKFISRILNVTPLTASPQGFEILNTNTPEFVWQPVNLSVAFTYKIEIFSQDFGRNVLIFSRENIDKGLNSFTVTQPINAGNYFWTISVVDEFGNWSRSKEASFIIN